MQDAHNFDAFYIKSKALKSLERDKEAFICIKSVNHFYLIKGIGNKIK